MHTRPLLTLITLVALTLMTTAHAQDLSPLRSHHVWLPMTGMTEHQIDDAKAAGYDTVMLKIHPRLVDNRREIDFSEMDRQIGLVTARGLNVLLPILGWVGLGSGRFWDVEERGEKIPNQLDPFWPEAMEQVEWYFGAVMDHYKTSPRVVGFAPTWGIYGEAGFTSLTAGRSEHALARFNEWQAKQNLPPLDRLPTRAAGPNTEFNRFVRFRYLYLESAFDAMIRRLKRHANNLPVGMWQEMYPVIGYLWTMVEVPSTDFALYESCFPCQTTHHPEKSLAETMGFRYRCRNASDYRDYYLPLVARKRGDGGRFMGCQLSNSYAVQSYGWTQEEAKQAGFERWEDEFGPVLKRLLDTPLESPRRDVLMVFPTYAAAALSDHPRHSADAQILDTILRSYGCQMSRYGSPRLDKMSVRDMNRFRLIVIPEAAYLLRETYEKLKRITATVLMTCCFGQSLNGEYVPFGGRRTLDGVDLQYLERPTGEVSLAAEHALTSGLSALLAKQPVKLATDEAFSYAGDPPGIKVLLRCGQHPLLSLARDGRMVFLHGHLFASSCDNPNRKPPQLSGSRDPSANEVDGWGPYDSSHPQNAFGYAVIKRILDLARVEHRVPEPKLRIAAPYLGDHVEPVGMSANLAYNNTGQPQTFTVRTPFQPKGLNSRRARGRYETEITVPPFSYIALQPRS